MSATSIYLDHAAATPLDPEVLAAMRPFFSDQFYNPSALYGPAVETARALAVARADIALVIGAKPTEIIFTAGATEANNLAIHGIMRNHQKATVAISAIEHDSVRLPALGYAAVTIPVDNEGLVDCRNISHKINDSVVLVSVIYANNEVGTIQPIRKIAAELENIRKVRKRAGNTLPLYFHIDAAQAGNYLDLHIDRLGVDMMTINGGKLYGPKQTGILYVKRGIQLRSLIEGGGQERNLRGGTENVAGAVGFAKALQTCVALRSGESLRLRNLQTDFIKMIKTAFPKAIINGSLKQRLPNNLHVTFPDNDNERILMALDMRAIYASAGSACSAGSDEPSKVLEAMGLSSGHIRSSLRFSMGRSTRAKDLRKTVDCLGQILA